MQMGLFFSKYLGRKMDFRFAILYGVWWTSISAGARWFGLFSDWLWSACDLLSSLFTEARLRK